MLSGAGDACSRRRWPLSTISSSAFISLLLSCFSSRVLQSRSVLLSGERGLRRRHELRSLAFTVVLLTALPPWWVFSPTMSREGSLTNVVLWFTGAFSGESPSGCRWTRHTVNFLRALQLLMEFRSQRSSFRFPPPGSETTKQPCGAPLHFYDARSQDISSLNPNLIGSYSLSSPLSFDDNRDYSGEPISPPASDVIRATSILPSRSMTSLTFPAWALGSGPRSIAMWAWPNFFAEVSNPVIKFRNPRLSNHNVRLVVGLISLDNLKISYGFIGVYNLSLLQYHFFRKNFSVDPTIMISFLSSSFDKESSSLPYLPSMNGDVLSEN
ncbi:unnamed protein product [Eruca vesicaria subsp. sativa]|uniref:Uncharacterized protein n=1 Tax=Eruca vesicaria subsp. sativa TaxID=29727 RepID=A0ABC8JSN0_ERUVS|nr:unnamed protein product [Eruca vesicaria subsp. sativa]